MVTKGYLGIDAGTQGLSVVFTDENLETIATGQGNYEMLPGLQEGCYEQYSQDWEAALVTAMENLRNQLASAHSEMNVLAIGISGQMHGEVLADAEGNVLGPARLWCDSRNELEGTELTQRFGVKMPKRITAARWLWTVRNQLDKALATNHLTTPAGWIQFRLTGRWNLGIGDASGMFPIDQETLDFDKGLLLSFDKLTSSSGVLSLGELLPTVKRAGEDGGTLDSIGARILGLPEGIPVAPAEGDQPAALAGSLIGQAGMVSVSFGTSVCANSVGDRAFTGVSKAVDHFCAVDGKPINMIWLRNGTTFMNTVVEMFGQALGGDRGTGFEFVIPKLLEASPDCGGILALPFMDDEPGLGIERGGTAMLIGLNPDNASPGNAVKAALLSTIFNLRLGSEILDAQGYPKTEFVLTGGLAKTQELGQILADVFGKPVTVPRYAEEGTAWGAALLAKYRHQKFDGDVRDWSNFLNDQTAAQKSRFEPDLNAVERYNEVYVRYKRLVNVQSAFAEALTSDRRN